MSGKTGLLVVDAQPGLFDESYPVENEVLSDVAHPDHQITVTPATEIVFTWHVGHRRWAHG